MAMLGGASVREEAALGLGRRRREGYMAVEAGVLAVVGAAARGGGGGGRWSRAHKIGDFSPKSDRARG